MKNLLIILLAAVVSGACAPKTAISQNYNFKDVKRIGIMAFDTPTNRFQGAENVFAKYLIQNGFTVVERAKIEQVLAEQNLSVTGYLSPETTKLIGKILGVDLLLTGQITSYTPSRTSLAMVETRSYQSNPVYTTQTSMGPDGKPIFSQVPVGQQVTASADVVPTEITTSAQVGVVAKLVDVETGEIVWIGTDTGSDTNALNAVDASAKRLINRLAKDIKKLNK